MKLLGRHRVQAGISLRIPIATCQCPVPSFPAGQLPLFDHTACGSSKRTGFKLQIAGSRAHAQLLVTRIDPATECLSDLRERDQERLSQIILSQRSGQLT
jgi:hypothetical protein